MMQPLLGGIQLGMETEFNRFVNPHGYTPEPQSTARRPTGSRTHVLGTLSRPIQTPGWSLVPKLALNAASYSLDAPLTSGPFQNRTDVTRVIPTISIDSAWTLERDADWFGRSVRQTLEPRMLYVKTPYREQAGLPNFDSAVRDFNVESIYTDNAFSGVDRVSDSHQLTSGVTTRVLVRDQNFTQRSGEPIESVVLTAIRRGPCDAAACRREVVRRTHDTTRAAVV